MRGEPEPPLEIDEITPAWLSAALGAPVGNLEVLDRHSGTTGRLRLAVSYDDDGGDDGGRPSSVFVKLAPFDERQRRFVDLTGLGVAEARFYRELAGSVPVRVPRPFYAAAPDSGRYVMVLEDLVASGCRFPSPRDDDIADLADAIVAELAALHASLWAHPALAGDLAWVSWGARLAFEGGGPFIARALDRFGDEMPPVFRRLAQLYIAQTPRIAELFAVGPHTLAHGDPHLGNLFVDRRRPGFYDWGMLTCRAGMWDVAYVLCGSIPAEARRARERDWIHCYLDRLAVGGVRLHPDVAWEQYRLFAVYAWASATSTAAMGDRWQTEEVGRGGMARATTAVEDLDSLGLLEELLAR
jgi:Phosphotransferase enzyme family